MKGVTQYSGFEKSYFLKILNQIIKIGNLQDTDKRILDFGCGLGVLKKTLHTKKVINFDIVEELSDIENWKDVKFEILVANQVFCTFEHEDLVSLLNELKVHNKDLIMIVGTSRRGLLNKIGMFLTGRFDAHDSTKLALSEEMSIYEKVGLKILDTKNIYFLCNVIKMKFVK